MSVFKRIQENGKWMQVDGNVYKQTYIQPHIGDILKQNDQIWIHRYIRSVAAIFHFSCCEIFHISTFSPCFPSLKMATVHLDSFLGLPFLHLPSTYPVPSDSSRTHCTPSWDMCLVISCLAIIMPKISCHTVLSLALSIDSTFKKMGTNYIFVTDKIYSWFFTKRSVMCVFELVLTLFFFFKKFF